MATTHPSLRRIEKRLSEETRAEVRFDAGYRGLYSTDASLYQIEPLGVAIPRITEDVPAIVRIAAEEGVSIVPRGGATSLSGQTVGPGLIIDFSKYLNRIGIVDRDRMRVRVEPGVVLDALNAQLASMGLMFGPDVSTSDRATIGGMIGNNSAGARSLRYGKTVDHVEALDVVLDDGTPCRFEPLDATALESLRGGDDRVSRLACLVRDEVAKNEAEIRRRFPRILRRVSGYNLDEFVPGLSVRARGWPAEEWRFNLSRLIVGSEGTLAVVAGAWLRVVPKPAAEGLLVCSFSSIVGALESVIPMLAFEPIAIEMLDRMILDLAAQQPDLSQHLEFVSGNPLAVLAVQFHGDSAETVRAACEGLAKVVQALPGVVGVRVCLDAQSRASFWKVRKAGLSLLMGMVGDAKPVAFVEDTAVATDRLPEFYRRFEQIVARHGTQASCYGHADVGCLHIRPILNVKSHHGVDQMQAIARDVASLVQEFEGAMSGEHGDGLSRSRWNRKLFGERVYEAFRKIKRAFDPYDRLNPGKVVAEPDIGANLRIGPEYRAHVPATTAFDFTAQGGFAGAVELCSGVGACRKSHAGTMCPSYMVTLEEEHTTRGRANALRLAIDGHLPEGLNDSTVHEALELCLQCKACKSECPSNVDLAKLKAETLYQSHKADRVPLPDLAMAYLDRLFALGHWTWPLANRTVGSRAFRWILQNSAGIDARRVLPRFAPQTLHHWFRRRRALQTKATRGRVYLFNDCFTNYLSPNDGKAAVHVLEAAGYEVKLAPIGCCGRTAISKGVMDRARTLAAANVAALRPLLGDEEYLVGCEPSCILTFADEYREFRLGESASWVARRARLVDDFVADLNLVPQLRLKPLNHTVLLHGHCHQKALVGAGGSLAMLTRVPELRVRPLDSGCCGMAGSFGYELGHYEVSAALARRVIVPTVRANPDSILAAPGFSCRSQVSDLEGISALHPIELVARALLN